MVMNRSQTVQKELVFLSYQFEDFENIVHCINIHIWGLMETTEDLQDTLMVLFQ